MNFFEWRERKLCGSQPLTPFENPSPPKEYIPLSEDLVEMEPMLVTEENLSDEQLLAWKLAHGVDL